MLKESEQAGMAMHQTGVHSTVPQEKQPTTFGETEETTPKCVNQKNTRLENRLSLFP